MLPPDPLGHDEAAAWQAFVRQLAAELAGLWPAMPQRLGERYGAFVELAVQQAGQRGFDIAAGVARYVNLFFVWGPNFHDKPGFEWAQALLVAPREREWQTIHQLVHRSLAELARRTDARIDPGTLAAADARLIDRFGPLGRRGRLRLAQPLELARQACDIEAIELRLLDEDRLQNYELDHGVWRRRGVALPSPLRIKADLPVPERLWLLSPQSGRGAPARLQWRSRSHRVCDGSRHPALGFVGPHGRWAWVGHETHAANWPLMTREQPLPAPGIGAVVGEETSPEFHRIELDTCGLRDEGNALGAMTTVASVLPAEQWWVELNRAPPIAQTMLPGPRRWSGAATRCRVECEGGSEEARAFERQFVDGLDAEVARGVQRLAAAWERLPGLRAAGLEVTLGLLVGRAAMSWGWAYAPEGIDVAAFMRFVAEFDLKACQADLQFSGELSLAGARSRVALKVAGQASLSTELRREAPAPSLSEVLMGATASWKWPFALECDPIAGHDPSLLQATGAVSGALVGEAGLQPRLSGGGGFEWFARLRVEPVKVPVMASDPVLGRFVSTLTLLPAVELLNWSVR